MLEDQLHGATELVPILDQNRCSAEQHRRVRIVAAGVQDTGHFGCKRQARFLLNRERISIGPQGDRARRIRDIGRALNNPRTEVAVGLLASTPSF